MKKVDEVAKTYQQFERARKELVAKIKPFIKNGHVPARDRKPYSICFVDVNKNINCFEHACFNFSDLELLELDVNFVESLVLGGKYAWACAETTDEMECEIEQFLEDCGLKFEECERDAILKNNQWKVALFLSPDWEKSKHYHFLLQKKDKTWSGKDGFLSSGSTTTFEQLEERIRPNGDVYDLHKTFAITNPYVKEK